MDIRLDVAATAELVMAEGPDSVILATGALPGPPPFAVESGAHVIDEFEALGGPAPTNEHVVVVDFGVRAEASAVVETLVSRGNDVTWVSSALSVGIELDPATLPRLLARLARHGVRRVPESVVTRARAGTVDLVNVFDGTQASIENVGTVVVVGNKVSQTALTLELEATIPAMQAIGDCIAPRHVAIAIYEGELAGRAA